MTLSWHIPRAIVLSGLVLAIAATPGRGGQVLIDQSEPPAGIEPVPGSDGAGSVVLPAPGGGAGTIVIMPSPGAASSAASTAGALIRNAVKAGTYARPDEVRGGVVLPSGNGASTGNDPATNNANALIRSQQRARAYATDEAPGGAGPLIVVPDPRFAPTDANAAGLDFNQERAEAYASGGRAHCGASVAVGVIGDVVVVDRSGSATSVTQGVTTTTLGGCR